MKVISLKIYLLKELVNIKAWVNIQYGCDKFCTYCIVPYTRGKQRSRMPENIIDEVRCLYNNGYKEVTLLGQNVNAYGKDLNINYTMANLLEDVAKIGIERVRFVTSHPWDFNDEMIDIIAKYDNIMPYIHLPLQSGSSDILKKMGRRYTKEEYLNMLGQEGSTPKEIYENVSKMMELPEGITPEFLTSALCAREDVLSTAVGNGIALPHARAPIMKEEKDQRICVVYLKKPLDMKAPDERSVFVMFVLLTHNSQIHLKVLSSLAGLFRSARFRKALEELFKALNISSKCNVILTSPTVYFGKVELPLLLNDESVCAGYSEVFQYIANILGYECYSVSGSTLPTPEDNTFHEWNIIKLNDKNSSWRR